MFLLLLARDFRGVGQGGSKAESAESSIEDAQALSISLSLSLAVCLYPKP